MCKYTDSETATKLGVSKKEKNFLVKQHNKYRQKEKAADMQKMVRSTGSKSQSTISKRQSIMSKEKHIIFLRTLEKNRFNV